MSSLLKRRRGRLAAGGAATGILLTSLLFAGTAVASPNSPSPAQNNIIIGGGSSTTYYMMQALDTLYNSSQGCQIFDPTGANQELNLACESAVNASTGDTFTTPENLTAPFGENPYNDIAVEEPYTGSSNGINQVAGNPAHGYPFSYINFARSSRAIKTSNGVITDAAGENFVAYAKDGGQQVIIYPHAFAPRELFANEGTIVFTNVTGTTQRVTVLDYPSASAPARSGPIPPGGTWSVSVQNVIALTYKGSNGSGGVLNVGVIPGL
jgi:hypothetical protein